MLCTVGSCCMVCFMCIDARACLFVSRISVSIQSLLVLLCLICLFLFVVCSSYAQVGSFGLLVLLCLCGLRCCFLRSFVALCCACCARFVRFVCFVFFVLMRLLACLSRTY